MVKISKRFLSISATVLGLASFGTIYQNCGNGFMFGQRVSELPSTHPPVESAGDMQGEAVQTKTKLLIGDQRFLSSAFREAFLTPESDGNEKGFLEAVLVQEFHTEQHLLGRGCDPIESGDGGVCAGIINNASIAMSPSTSSGREAARLQVCRRVIANDQMMRRVVAKISPKDITPTPETLEEIVRLFYPNTDQEVVDASVNQLVALDYEMAKGSERILDRWKLLVLTVCESSGWEML